MLKCIRSLRLLCRIGAADRESPAEESGQRSLPGAYPRLRAEAAGACQWAVETDGAQTTDLFAREEREAPSNGAETGTHLHAPRHAGTCWPLQARGAISVQEPAPQPAHRTQPARLDHVPHRSSDPPSSPPPLLEPPRFIPAMGKHFSICSSSESDSLFLFQLLPSNSENPNTPAYPPLQTVLSSATAEKAAHPQFSAVCDTESSAKRQEGGEGYSQLLKVTLVINIYSTQAKTENS